MSYDLYKSELGTPDLKEAVEVIDVKEGMEDIEPNPRIKLKIAMRLVEFNPRLEGFKFDYDEIAKLQGTTVEQAKNNFTHIELHTPEWDLATQISIFDNIVSIEVPYRYMGNEAEKVFAKVDLYTKVIGKAAGYFVYDPQTSSVYDPTAHDFTGLPAYKRFSGIDEPMTVEQDTSRPWWKLW
jgi:hypothetical protein